VLLLLPQLDAGVSEQVLLQSRDERSLLVVSYADIKVGHGCFVTAYVCVCAASSFERRKLYMDYSA
jgi:hypothetical protein